MNFFLLFFLINIYRFILKRKKGKKKKKKNKSFTIKEIIKTIYYIYISN